MFPNYYILPHIGKFAHRARDGFELAQGRPSAPETNDIIANLGRGYFDGNVRESRVDAQTNIVIRVAMTYKIKDSFLPLDST
jgi:hypothetical protein